MCNLKQVVLSKGFGNILSVLNFIGMENSAG